MTKILVSGSSGFIGKELVRYLREKKNTVVRLVRRKDPSETDSIYWDPEAGAIDPKQLIGIDEVIHLAGSPIFQGRWTAQKRGDFSQPV
ncbi:MAG: NAD-dependent epimerase/dehydratase family protein [Rhabdochlamydiaceae bacterium]|jgi:NAD dependent epimerase/dehydratase family enzyme